MVFKIKMHAPGTTSQLGTLIEKKKKKTVHTRADEIPVTSVQDALAVVRSPLGEQQQ